MREKTLLGETYIELTPGPTRGPPLPEGGKLANAQVVPAVQLDQIFNTFNPTTRDAFRTWQQEVARAVTGNDQNLNNVLGNLPSFAVNFTQLLQVLDIQHTAVVNLVRNGGTTFAALNRDPAALRNLITAGDTTFGTLARNNAALADTIHVFPEFLTQQRLTMAALKPFSLNADPVIRDLIPSARLIKPTVAAVEGMGLCFLPKWLIAHDLEEKRLELVLSTRAGGQAHLYAVYPSRKYLSAKVRTFVDFLADHPKLRGQAATGG